MVPLAAQGADERYGPGPQFEGFVQSQFQVALGFVCGIAMSFGALLLGGFHFVRVECVEVSDENGAWEVELLQQSVAAVGCDGPFEGADLGKKTLRIVFNASGGNEGVVVCTIKRMRPFRCLIPLIRRYRSYWKQNYSSNMWGYS